MVKLPDTSIGKCFTVMLLRFFHVMLNSNNYGWLVPSLMRAYDNKGRCPRQKLILGILFNSLTSSLNNYGSMKVINLWKS